MHRNRAKQQAVTYHNINMKASQITQSPDKNTVKPNLKPMFARNKKAANINAKLLIVSCCDHRLWYADKVGKTVPFLGIELGEYKSTQPEGYINFVNLMDGKIIIDTAPDPDPAAQANIKTVAFRTTVNTAEASMMDCNQLYKQICIALNIRTQEALQLFKIENLEISKSAAEGFALGTNNKRRRQLNETQLAVFLRAVTTSNKTPITPSQELVSILQSILTAILEGKPWPLTDQQLNALMADQINKHRNTG